MAYWGLTHAQAAHYHARLSRYFAREFQRYADLSTKYAMQADRLGRISLALMLLAVVVGLLAFGLGQ